jgi:hypothetical protein
VKLDHIRRVVFVARSFTGESLRSALAITKLENVALFGVCEQPLDGNVAKVFHEVVCVEDTQDAKQLLEAARALQLKHGPLDRIVTTYEILLEPVAETVAVLGLPGMNVATVRGALDKSLLKATLEQAGVGTARSSLVRSEAEAAAFVSEGGYPIVLKPLNGSGALATWIVSDPEQLQLALELTTPSSERPLLAEEFLTGVELSIDTVTIASEPRFSSVCCYRPTILGAVEMPSVQWRCIMPREIGHEYRTFVKQGLKAVRALSVGDAMTHMEGFLCEDGEPRFIDATLRPAGARIAPMFGFAYDIDPYLVWARATLDSAFDGPWERKFAVGTIFLRGTGSGSIERVASLEAVKGRLGDLIVDMKAPVVGAAKSDTYTGDGYITVRHSETSAIEQALDYIAQTVRIAYSEVQSSSLRDDWTKRLQYNQLYKPAWETHPQITQIG